MQFLMLPFLVAFFHLLVNFIIGRYVKIRKKELIAFAITINLVSLVVFGTIAVDQFVTKPDFQIDSAGTYLRPIPLSNLIIPGAYIYAFLFLLGSLTFYGGRKLSSKLA